MTASNAARVRAVRRRALDVILPSEAETMLLRALLWPGVAGAAAWQHWFDVVVGGPGDRGGVPENVKALLPMLHSALRSNGVKPERAFASYVRAAYVRERLRAHAYRRILATLLDATAAAAIRPIILGGRALAETVYRDPDCRHSHGIRLLIRDADAATLARALPSLEYRLTRSHTPGVVASCVHRSGLPLELCTVLLAPPHDRTPVDDLFARCLAVPGFHVNARMLCPEDELFRICARAAISPSRRSLRWACDAWLLMDSYGERLDWSLVTRRAQGAGISLALSVVFGYLARDLRAAVPSDTLAELEAEAERADDLAYELAMLAALPGSHARMWNVIRNTPGIRLQLAVLRPLVLPAPSALRAIRSDGRAVPLTYALRPMRYLSNRLVALLRNRSSMLEG